MTSFTKVLEKLIWLSVLSVIWVLIACDDSAHISDLAKSTGPELQAELDLWKTDPKHHGVSASVIFADGTQWSGVSGWSSDGEPLQPDHLISIASITKTMTGAVILQLAAESVLSLDDPIGRWLPPHIYIDSSITIRQLLNHTNGLSNYTANPTFSSTVNEDKSHIFAFDELLAFLGPPEFAPGIQTKYTNTSFILLGEIAKSATGKPIETLYHDRLWSPLGLNEVFLPVTELPPGPVAKVLRSSVLTDPSVEKAWFSAMHSAFGLMASARNIAQWGKALFGNSVLSGAMQSEMRGLVPAAGNIPGEYGAGLGIRGYNYFGRIQYGHSGGSPFGSSLLIYDPQKQVTVAVLMNQSGGADHFILAPKLLEIASK